MELLAPIDGSDCSQRALEFATEFATRYDASIHVVHFTEVHDEEADDLLEAAAETVSAAGVEVETEVVSDAQLSDLKSSDRIGEDVLELVEDRGYDHVVMGHHGSGTVERFILGSAAETVARAAAVPVTVVP